MGGWSKKWQFSLTLCSENVLVGGWVVQKSLKTPLRNIKMAPNKSFAICSAGSAIWLKLNEQLFMHINSTGAPLKPDKTHIRQSTLPLPSPHSIFQNLGKTAVLSVLPPMAPLVLLILYTLIRVQSRSLTTMFGFWNYGC